VAASAHFPTCSSVVGFAVLQHHQCAREGLADRSGLRVASSRYHWLNCCKTPMRRSARIQAELKGRNNLDSIRKKKFRFPPKAAAPRMGSCSPALLSMPRAAVASAAAKPLAGLCSLGAGISRGCLGRIGSVLFGTIVCSAKGHRCGSLPTSVLGHFGRRSWVNVQRRLTPQSVNPF
jgi:hypothetical protein